MFARTSRLTLRPGWPEDAAAVAQAIAHEHVIANLSRVPWPYGEDDAQEWLATPRKATDICLLILSHDAPAPRLIGAISLDDTADGEPELGYWLTPSAWGRGYATEAGHAVLHMARHARGLTQVRARHFIDNPASARVLGKLGFRETGRAVTISRARRREVASVTLVCDLADEPARAMPLAA
jgi:RimJ/RimL family protein N-acetyltransferase